MYLFKTTQQQKIQYKSHRQYRDSENACSISALSKLDYVSVIANWGFLAVYYDAKCILILQHICPRILDFVSEERYDIPPVNTRHVYRQWWNVNGKSRHEDKNTWYRGLFDYHFWLNSKCLNQTPDCDGLNKWQLHNVFIWLARARRYSADNHPWIEDRLASIDRSTRIFSSILQDSHVATC